MICFIYYINIAFKFNIVFWSNPFLKGKAQYQFFINKALFYSDCTNQTTYHTVTLPWVSAMIPSNPSCLYIVLPV